MVAGPAVNPPVFGAGNAGCSGDVIRDWCDQLHTIELLLIVSTTAPALRISTVAPSTGFSSRPQFEESTDATRPPPQQASRPSQYDETCERQLVVSKYCRPPSEQSGVFVLPAYFSTAGQSTATRQGASNPLELEDSGSSASRPLKTEPATRLPTTPQANSIHQQHAPPSLSPASFLNFIPLLFDLSTFAHDGRQMSNSNPSVEFSNPTASNTQSNDLGDFSDLVAAIQDAAVTDTTDNAAASGVPDALSILYSALPSQIVSALQSDVPFSALPTVAATSTEESSSTTASTSQTSQPTSSTASSTISSTTQSSSSITTTSTSSSSTTTTTTSSSSSASSTLSTSVRPSTTSSADAQAATTAAPPTSRDQLSNGAIAGIATGVVATAILILFGVVFFLQRRRRGKAPWFGPRTSHRSTGSGRAYPEVAWLYDPSPTPPRTPRLGEMQQTHDESERALLQPHMRGGAGGVQHPQTIKQIHPSGGSPQLPEVVPHRGYEFESPLLPPQIGMAYGGADDDSPPRSSGSGSGRSYRSARTGSTPSPDHGHGRRPLHAIYESREGQ